MYSVHGMFSNKMAGNNERVSREFSSIKSKESQISHKIVRSKFPGKPTKCSTRSRVNLRTQVRPDETENSLAAEDICRGFISVFAFDNQDTTRTRGTRLQISRAAEAQKERLQTSPHKTVFDGGGGKRTRSDAGAQGGPSKVAKKVASRTCVVAQRLVKRAKGGTVAPKKEQKTNKAGNFTLPARSAHSRRQIKPNRKFLNEEEANPPRVILREARLQVGVPAPSPPARGPFSSPTCAVCGGLREGAPPAPGVKPPIRSCSTCYRKAKVLAKREKTLECQGRPGSPCAALSTDCDRCWLQRSLSFFAITALLRGKLANHLLDPAAISSFISPLEVKPKPEPAKESPKKPVAEIRQRLQRGGPRVKNVCRSASVALGQPAALFPPISPPPPPANVSLPLPSTQPISTKSKPVAACPDPVLLPAAAPVPEPVSEPETTVLAEDVPKPASATAIVPIVDEPAVLPPPPAMQVKPKRKKSKVEEEKEELISMDFWENYDPEEVCDKGFSLIGSVPFCATPLCYLCGSAGLHQMVVCGCCCEPYHTFCVGLAEDAGGWDWVCPRCRVCAACGHASGQQLSCVRCENSYHTACAGGRLHHAPDRPWVCWLCLRCKSCNGEDVSVFVGNLPLCKTCFVLRQRGNFCPLCQQCYNDDDYDCKMMECGSCHSWVHAKCEGLSDEKYQVLSFLPESIEFICRICCVMPPAPWWLAVEAELKAGYLGVLKALSKNKTACRVLKWSPRKLTDCSCRRTTKSVDSEECIQSDGGGCEGDSLVSNSCECLSFLEDDRYSSRSKPFSADLFSVKQKVLDCEYSSLTHFHNDMTAMMESAHVSELLDCYHSALKEVFPWFDPRGGKVLGASRSVENTPIKTSPIKAVAACEAAPCLVPAGVTRPAYVGDAPLDDRSCVLCKGVGDAAPGGPGRLLYCGNNEWIHVNCALWSNEVFEEIDGSLQQVHLTLARARQSKCSQCGLRGASVNCCQKTCSEYYHFGCAHSAGAVFFQNNRLYCWAHAADADVDLLEGERRFEVRRAVYVELDKRRIHKPVPVSQVQLAVGSLRVQALGRFVPRLSDLPETIMPVDFVCYRWFFSTLRPWQIVLYRIQVRLEEPEQTTGLDLGINLTVDHSRPEVEPTLRTATHFLTHLVLPPDVVLPSLGNCDGTGPHRGRRKRRLPEPLEDLDNQDLLPPELEEAISKDLSHDILDGISVQDIFQAMSEQEREGEEEETGRRRAVAVTLRSGNLNVTSQVTKWKKKPQEGKENKLVPWCVKLLQVDGGVDSSSSSGSEAGESPARCVDTPVIPQLDGICESDSDDDSMSHDFMDFREKAAPSVPYRRRGRGKPVPQLDGTEDSDYETEVEAEQEGDGTEGSEESPVECSKCRCTYRTQRSYEKHLETRCHELLSSSDDDEPAPVVSKQKKTVMETIVTNTNSMPMMMQPNLMTAQTQQFQPMVQYVMPATVPAAYQLVLPPSPMIIAPSSQPVYGVVADPQTGGMYLTPTQPAAAPPPLLYNMETIVSNTVQQSIHQYVHTSYSHTQSTQLMHSTKQIMNMPQGYVLSPNDLICVPVTPPRVALPATPPTPVAPIQWTPAKPSPKPISAPTIQWTPTAPKPSARQPPSLQFVSPPQKQFTTVTQKTVPKPRPAKAKPLPQRSGGLVDFINNFTIEDGPTEVVPNRTSEKSPRNSKTVQQHVSQAPMVLSVSPQASSNKSILSSQNLALSNQSIYAISTSQSMRPCYTISTQNTAIQPTFTLTTQNGGNQPTYVSQNNTVQPTFSLAPNGSLQQAYTLSPLNGSLPTTLTLSPQNRVENNTPTFTISPQGGQPTYVTPNNSFKVSQSGSLQPTQSTVLNQQKRVNVVSSQPNYTFTVVSNSAAASSAVTEPIYTLSVVPQPSKSQLDSSQKQQKNSPFLSVAPVTKNSSPVPSSYTVTIVSEPNSATSIAGQSQLLYTDSLPSSNAVASLNQKTYSLPSIGELGVTQYKKPVVAVPPAARAPKTAVVRPVMSMPCLEVACEEPYLSMPMLVSPHSPASCSPFSPQPQISRSANLRTYSQADLKQNVASCAPSQQDEKLAASTVHFPSSLVLPISQAVNTLLDVKTPESPVLLEIPSVGPLLGSTVPEFLSPKPCHFVSKSSPACSPKSPLKISSPNSSVFLSSTPPKLSPLAAHNPHSTSNPLPESGFPCSLSSSDSFFFQPPVSATYLQPSLAPYNPHVNNHPSAPHFTSTQEPFSQPTSSSPLSSNAVNIPAENTPKKEKDRSPKKGMSPLSLAPPRLPNRQQPPSPMAAPPPPRQKPQLMYDVTAADGLSFSSKSLADVWNQICMSVQNARAAHNMPQPHMAPRSFEIVGVGNHGLQHLLEQLPGAGLCHNYRPRYHNKTPSLQEEEFLTPVEECRTGCARTEGFSHRKDPDRFGWLASRHRQLPKATVEKIDSDAAVNRRSTNLPMAMRYRLLREAPSNELFVYRSKIHGMGLFCTREIDPGEMVIEYAGELIRGSLTDKREKLYTEKGIGCYMFRIDDLVVVDATVRGNSARFINHSCEPNCYSKVVDILGRKHIIIFALRRIPALEELTYDYKFPFEDVKISCHCQSRKCRKYLN